MLPILLRLMMHGSIAVIAVVSLLASGHHGECEDHHDEDDGGAEPTHLCHCPGHVMTVPEAPVAFTPKIVAAQVLPELVILRCDSAVIEIDPPTDKRA